MKLKDIKESLNSSQTVINQVHDSLGEANFVLSRRDLTTADVEDAKQRIGLATQDLQLIADANRQALESIKMLETVYQQASGLLLAAFSSDIDDLRQTVDQSRRVRVLNQLPPATNVVQEGLDKVTGEPQTTTQSGFVINLGNSDPRQMGHDNA